MIDNRLPGRLIAVEGLDGSGKSTQLRLLHKWLGYQGVKVFLTQWNSSVIVKRATSKGKKRQLLTPLTFSLIHATDFADRYEQQILPLLKAGYIVLADRYIYTAYVRDVVRGCSLPWVQNLYRFAVVPDLTLYFKAPLSVAMGRILTGRTKLNYFEAGMDLKLSTDIEESFTLFQDRMGSHYDELATEYGFEKFDAQCPIEQTQKRVREVVSQAIDLALFKQELHRS